MHRENLNVLAHRFHMQHATTPSHTYATSDNTHVTPPSNIYQIIHILHFSLGHTRLQITTYSTLLSRTQLITYFYTSLWDIRGFRKCVYT